MAHKTPKYQDQYNAYLQQGNLSASLTASPDGSGNFKPKSYKQFAKQFKNAEAAATKKSKKAQKTADKINDVANKISSALSSVPTNDGFGSNNFVPGNDVSNPTGVIGSKIDFPWAAVLLAGALYFLVFKKGKLKA